jgi:flagellin-specific chaperone FliS
MLDMKSGGIAAMNLRRFYTHLRGQMLSAQFRLSPAILRDQVRALIDVRGAWQQVDSRGAGGAHLSAYADQSASGASASVNRTAPSGHQETRVGSGSFSCSG